MEASGDVDAGIVGAVIWDTKENGKGRAYLQASAQSYSCDSADSFSSRVWCRILVVSRQCSNAYLLAVISLFVVLLYFRPLILALLTSWSERDLSLHVALS